MSISQLEKQSTIRKTVSLSFMVAEALRTACYQESRTLTDITETALTEWLVRHQYMAILDGNETDESSTGDTNE